MSDDRKGKIINLFKKSRSSKGVSNEPNIQTKGQTIIGNNNIQAGGDVNINKREVKRIRIESSPDYITPAQKQTIKEKIGKLVEIGVFAGGNPKDLFPHWWSRLQKKFRVNSYLELHQDQYDAVLKWLSQQKAINRPKLRRRNNQAWRNDLYKGIWSKVREINKPKEWVYNIVQERLKKTVNSLTELGEQDLKSLYDIIIRM